MMRYLDVCAGISASTVAWAPLGWQAAAYSEIEAAPCAILAHHYPDVPLHGDFTTIRGDEYGPIDLLVGGTPCQDFSVAGLRAGLDGDRGNLSLEFLRLADRARPRWLVWENVPGVLSIDGGRAFGAILGGLGELGYGAAYRILDAQHFGVPQRRRRVFVVGYLGDWRRAAAVLFERHSLSGHPAPRREAGEGVAVSPSLRAQSNSSHRADSQAFVADIAGTLPAGGNRTGGDRQPGMGQETADTMLVAYGGGNTSGPIPVAAALAAHGRRQDFEVETFITHALRGEGFDASEDGTGRGTPLVPVPFDTTQITSAANYSRPQPGDPCHPLAAGAHPPAIAFTSKDHGQDAGEIAPTLRAMQGEHANAGGQVAVAFDLRNGTADETAMPVQAGGMGDDRGLCPNALPHVLGFQSSQSGFREVETHATLDANMGSRRHNGVAIGSAVRRLTPRECERLQGFPDDYTLVPYRKGMMADGPRYKALGNSMAVPVMRWIGERIAAVEAITAERLAA